MKLATIVLLAAVVMFLSLGAFAVDQTANLSVSANVMNVCTVDAGTLDFGSYDPVAGTNHDATGSFDVQCANGGNASIKLDQGQNGTGTLAAPVRQLKHGLSDLLGYQLYSDTTREVVWEGETGISYTGNGDSETKTVYGRIPSGQNVAPGAYTDSVLITVTY